MFMAWKAIVLCDILTFDRRFSVYEF